MRLEDLNPENVQALEDWQLHSLRNVANRTYEAGKKWMAQLAKRKVGVSNPIPRDVLLDAYELLLAEMDRRGLERKPDVLDAKNVRKRLRGVDVSDMPPILVRESLVTLSGTFVRNPKAASCVEVRVDASELSEEFTQELEKRMAETLMGNTGKPVVVRRDAEGLEAPVLPVYDLVMIPRLETEDTSEIGDLSKRLSLYGESAVEEPESGPSKQLDGQNGPEAGAAVEFGKPYPSEHAARQLDPKQFREFRRENGKFGEGINVIWGITPNGKTKIQSIRFSAGKFTPDEAKKWLRGHGFKTTMEEATGVKKSTFIKSAEHRIVGGIVYTKDTVDGQGDSASAEDIFLAMKGWMLRGHPMKLMHKGRDVNVPVIECFFAETNVKKDGEMIPAGSWYVSNYIPPEAEGLWQDIKDGNITGYSMAGKANAIEV